MVGQSNEDGVGLMKARQDLYWQWAEETNFAAYGDTPLEWYVVLLVECVVIEEWAGELVVHWFF